MSAEEKKPFLSTSTSSFSSHAAGRDEFREVVQVDGSKRGCGGRLARLCKKKEEGTFSSSVGVMLSMLGAVVGTGNIWRFPRIVANHSEHGGLSFLLVWSVCLWLWSIPVILIEYGVGRYTRKTVIESFGTLLGPAFRFLGGFVVIVQFCITAYYSVLVGWCAYYFVISCAHSLPESLDESRDIWDTLQGSVWPEVLHSVMLVVAALCVSRGVSTIEPVNNVVVPVLLIIVTFCFYWAIYLPHASMGIIHLFTPSWESLKTSDLWLDALAQNAWDTGGGGAVFLTYATYMKRTHGAVKLGTITPILNNIISLLCGILIFSTVFSVQADKFGYDTPEIVALLKENGPANTGLTFIWMPLLFSSINIGRFLSALFFLCLSLAGLSSLIGLMELPIHCLIDFGIRRAPATIAVCVGLLGVGMASALDMNVLVNQDATWAYANIICGLFLILLAILYNIVSFRRTLYNEYGIGDWSLPWVWVFVVVFVAPLEATGMILWWIVENIIDHPGSWWQIETESIVTIVSQWVLAILIAIGLNWCMKPLRIQPPTNRCWRKVLGLLATPTRRSAHRDEETLMLRDQERKDYGTNVPVNTTKTVVVEEVNL